jgi:hypothetical protein
MKELRRFSARAWTPADEDKLRELAIAGASARAIGVQINRDYSCGPHACCPAEDHPE